MKSNALLIIILIVIVAIVGVYFGYNMFFNKPNLTNVFNTNNYQNIPITIYNTQNVSTPSPFQQQVAICNGDLGEDSNFAYVNNARLFDQINPNGQNVYFVDSSGNILYSWYAGQSIYYNANYGSSAKCHVWWIKLPNGIPANSYVTIYMYIGPNNTNYYQQYYPYVGASPDVDPSRKYDNGKYVFIAYGYFNNTFDGWNVYSYQSSDMYYESANISTTPVGIYIGGGKAYILPPNNGNIPKIPLVVEMAVYRTYGTDGIIIALFGNTNQQSNTKLGVSVPNLSTFVQFNFEGRREMVLKSAVTGQDLNSEYLSIFQEAIYLYLIVNSTYAQAGYYKYYSLDKEYEKYGELFSKVPLTVLNIYSLSKENVHANLNYNPFQYGTLQISAGISDSNSYYIIQWVVVRAYPPNGVMPRIYINSSTPSSSNLFNQQNFSIYTITIYNTQNIPTPAPFQQQIAICDEYFDVPSHFSYINNVKLFRLINSNGSNVYFSTKYNSSPDIYSWYAGQSLYYDVDYDNSAKCHVWWIKLPNGIPANSYVTIYMYIGPNNTNYYQQYYPYVGASPDVDPSRKYDNGKYVFIAYGYFNNTFDGWTAYVYNGTFTPTETPYGIQMLNNQTYEGTYILPPNNGNIPKIPLIVEEAWYSTEGETVNVIALFGNTNQQSNASGIESPIISYILFYNETIYSYLIVNSTYAQAGYYTYSYTQEWAPLTILNTYNMTGMFEYDKYYNLNYNPFQYGTLEIGAGSGSYTSYQYIQWVVARAYPPNGVMPRTYID